MLSKKDSDATEVVLEIQGEPVQSLETTIKGIMAAICYGVCSVSIAFINKMLMDTMKFDFPVLILVAQMLFTILALEILNVSQVISLPKFTIQRGWSFAAPAIFYGANAVLALSALAHMNIAMYGVLKRCVPLSTLIFSTCILKRGCPSKLTISSVCLLTIGCVIASYGDLGFNTFAYISGTLSNFTQALYLILVQKYSEKGISTVETLQLNSINTLPLLTAYSFINGEVWEVWDYGRFRDARFVVLFILAISVGCLLNYLLFLCTSLTSALTVSVVGGLKALCQTILGLFMFGGVSHNVPTFLGIAVNLTGGISYIFAKYIDNKSKMRKSLTKVMNFGPKTNLSNGSVGAKVIANGTYHHKDRDEPV